jgi:hypothetical protein
MMVAGEYYVGDLCYVLHDEWDEVCSILFDGRNDHGCNEGEFNLKDGRRFAMYNTAWGDGGYYDEQRREYSVDAGSIGCILLKDINLKNESNFTHGGQVINFPFDFVTGEDKGILSFGIINIDTDPIFDEDEGDEDY